MIPCGLGVLPGEPVKAKQKEYQEFKITLLYLAIANAINDSLRLSSNSAAIAVVAVAGRPSSWHVTRANKCTSSNVLFGDHLTGSDARPPSGRGIESLQTTFTLIIFATLRSCSGHVSYTSASSRGLVMSQVLSTRNAVQIREVSLVCSARQPRMLLNNSFCKHAGQRKHERHKGHAGQFAFRCCIPSLPHRDLHPCK